MSGALGSIVTAFLVTLTNNWASALTVMALTALIGAGLWLSVRPDHPLESTSEALAPAEARA